MGVLVECHGIFQIIMGVLVECHGIFQIIMGVLVECHGIFQIIMGVLVECHGIFQISMGVLVECHGIFQIIMGVLVEYHGIFQIIMGVLVECHGIFQISMGVLVECHGIFQHYQKSTYIICIISIYIRLSHPAHIHLYNNRVLLLIMPMSLWQFISVCGPLKINWRFVPYLKLMTFEVNITICLKHCFCSILFCILVAGATSFVKLTYNMLLFFTSFVFSDEAYNVSE
ncbi:unnamed protein product [Owenia fusiformis]|uniref:Uncharacterized protein n=1 Tax=Owenia fusiformis TaxID=6347 RepID=A0A8J1XQ78_OWEFU|nr:unnamed protein product [Owenia fusiformis]